MSIVLSILRMFGLIWPADKGSWNRLFCVKSPDMEAEQSGTYLEIFKRFGEPWWESGVAQNGKLAESLEEWTREEMRKEGWVR